MSISYYKDIYKILCQRHPNKDIYIISDHHFCHLNIIKYQRPEFNNTMEMNEYIINQHNSVVKEDDIVIFLGDFSFKKSSIKDLVTQMNGCKYLLLGNHDEESLSRCYGNLGFEGVFTNPVRINDMFLSHYPLEKGENESIHFELLVKEFNNSNGVNYHGHIHDRNAGEKPFLNVCCEAQEYRPLLIGHTESLKDDDVPLMINSKYFEEILKRMEKEENISPSLIISDYIYCMLLETMTPYLDFSFAYGSFPIYKKYGYISNFSDLDICMFYDENMSKRKNQELLKQLFDTVFESAESIDNLNLSVDKRFPNICIFELLYANKMGNSYRGYYDSNLVPLDIYRNTDFIVAKGCSSLENFMSHDTNLLSSFKFPKYESKFLNVNGDIANMSLQLLYQQGFSDKKALLFKKLKTIYRTHGKKDISNVEELDDIMSRFFIRNMMFFHTTRRKKEIDYVNEVGHSFDIFLDSIPTTLKLQMEEILVNPHSLFNTVNQELANTYFEDIPKKSKELIKSIK